MTKQEQYELLVKCCQEFGGILDNAFEGGLISEEDMSDAESTESALWAIAHSLKDEIENDGKMKVYNEFREVAMAVEEEYGLPLIVNEDDGKIEGYHCPHCNEPIFFFDWEEDYYEGFIGITQCPICEEDLEV